jgi:flap endonuclease-1
MLGCDYCETIRGIGPKRAIDLITEHKTIENVLAHIDKAKYTPPENWLFKEARELFLHPEVADLSTIELKWNEPDEEGLVKYMCTEKGFGEDRMRNGVKKILKSRTTGTQVRLDSFFTITSTTPNKRKTDESKENDKKKAKKGGTATYKKVK